MRLYVLLMLAVACIIPSVTSLKCHFCESSTTDLNCFQKRSRKDCDGSFTCAKTVFKIKGKENFFRGCIAHSYCDDPDSYCRANPGTTNCEVYCCEGDYCNSGNVAKSSIVFLLALAILAMLVQSSFTM